MSKAIQASWLSRPEDSHRIKAAWADLLSGERVGVDGALRHTIDDSWQRCLAGHVDPARGGTLRAVAPVELDALRRRHERLLSASAPFMIQARALLARTGTVMILTDPDGTILDVEGDGRLRDSVESACLTPGHNWQETSRGTNAIGTALTLGRAIQVHASEHFCEAVQKWTCSATVIRDPVDGTVLGVLDISGLRHSYSPHSLPLIATTADGIENRLAQQSLERHFQLLEQTVQCLASADGVIVFDDRGRLVKANERAAAALAPWGVALDAQTRLPVGADGNAPPPTPPGWVLASRVEPVFRGASLLGFVVSTPFAAFAPAGLGVPRSAPSPAAPALLATMIDQSASVVSLKDLDGRYVFVNRRFEEVFGVKSLDVLGRNDAELFGRAPAELMRGHDLEAMARSGHTESVDEFALGARLLRLAAVRFAVFDDAGRVRAVCTQASEIGTPAARGARPSAPTACDGEGVLVTDAAGTILTVNDAFSRITGYSRDEVVGRPASVLQSGLHSKSFFERMWRSLVEQGRWQGEIQNRRKCGEIFPEWLTIYAVADAGGIVQSYIAIFGDSSAPQDEARAPAPTTHDALTGLPNRQLLMERLGECIADAQRLRDEVAVVMIDLDHFKGINDALGHDVGDLLLQQVAERLRRCLCDAHTLARVGGDEFVAILRGCAADEVRRLAALALEYLSVSFCILQQEHFAAASIGIALFPGDGDSASALLRHADTALYDAKAQGRNRYRFFDASMQAQVQQRMSLESGLRAALDNDRFEVVYQPQRALADGSLVGAEALLRWHDPVLGDVPAARFIPAAEAAGLIATLSERVLADVLGRIALWRRRGLVPPRISVNVAAPQLREPHFVERVCELLAASGVPATALCLELTEGTLMEDLEAASRTLAALAGHGVAISIDDFGTGYSSLAYLGRLPVQELKVDQSFVRGIADEAGKRSIITAIIDMAHALGMQVLAEGIETEAQLAFLKERHCEMGQGYLFHRPLSADAFEGLFAPRGAHAPPTRLAS